MYDRELLMMVVVVVVALVVVMIMVVVDFVLFVYTACLFSH